jgi:hypothetical protein
MYELGYCYVCGGRVARYAESCPHCGHPNPFVGHWPRLEIGTIHTACVTWTQPPEYSDQRIGIEFAGGQPGIVTRDPKKPFSRLYSVGGSIRVRVEGVDRGYYYCTEAT